MACDRRETVSPSLPRSHACPRCLAETARAMTVCGLVSQRYPRPEATTTRCLWSMQQTASYRSSCVAPSQSPTREGRHSVDRVGQPGPQFVVKDYPCERSQVFDERHPAGVAPEQVDMREPARNDHQIYRAVTDDVICDVPLRPVRIPRFWLPRHPREYL